MNIVRQGMVIRSNEEGILWFIGGCAPRYWRSGKYYISQGGTQLGYLGSNIKVGGGTRIKAAALEKYAASLNKNYMQICIIPVLLKPNLQWKDPTYYTLTSNTNYQESINQIVLPSAIPQLLTYQPKLSYLAIDKINNFKYTSEGYTYLSKSIPNYLIDFSSQFPYPYPGLYTAGLVSPNYPSQLFLGLMRVVVINFPKISPFYSKANLLYPRSYDTLASHIFMLNDMSIGSVLYLGKYSPSNSGMCSDYGVLGLVSGVMNFVVNVGGVVTSDRGLLSQPPLGDFKWGFYILAVMKVPSASNIDDFIDGLGQREAVNIVLGSVRSARRAVGSLVASGVLAGIAFAAVMAVEDWESEEQIVSDSKKYVEKLNRVYNEVLNFINGCIESQPNLTRNEKVMYVQQAQEYLNGLIYDVDAEESEDDIISFLEDELSLYLENQGVSC
ncbi:hypothetical protein [Sulfurisphaera ohwakuensis]|uniref:Uncharacterized protein n=1 Tax=Sulfurisphaera ohwakuensis TaxID=69656 RepID=A0A650CE94_SULOH|nr:hypothetical protein [Sulfurisphaera ohwakuensis]MBB5252957.1 hypothetical protein [Sulfurisphaera ohwakuensis]QGR16114.1 hypothetical protein D1869_02100 [Sulfurisphaera ohwakuensis]